MANSSALRSFKFEEAKVGNAGLCRHLAQVFQRQLHAQRVCSDDQHLPKMTVHCIAIFVAFWAGVGHSLGY